jgi:hypothetical protein
MIMQKTPMAILLFVCGLLVPWGGATLAQTSSSSITGVVTDGTGGALPGVTVTIESPALIEGQRVVVSNTDGSYRIVDLRRGTYSLTFTLAGFRTIRREGIELTSGFTATVNAQLDLGALEETVTVSGESPLVDVRGSVSERALTQELLEGVPMGRNMYQAGLLMPGATTSRPDVGGSQSSQHTNLSAHGSSSSDITIANDGLDATAIHGGGGVAGNYYNQGFNEEVNIQTKALPAEVSSGGVLVNMIKIQGGNTFSGTVYASYTGRKFQSDNVSEAQRSLGMVDPDAVDKMYDMDVALRGPIVRDRLWFAAGTRRWRVDKRVANTYNFDGTQSLDPNILYQFDLSLTLQLNPSNRLQGWYEHTHKNRTHRLQTSSDYRFVMPEATFGAPITGPIANARWTSTVRPNFLVEAGFSMNGWEFTQDYQPNAAQDRLPRVDLVHSTLTGATPYELAREPMRHTWQLVASWLPIWKSGSHHFRFGGQYNTQTNNDRRHTGGFDLEARYRDGVPDSVRVMNTPTATDVKVYTHGLFVQDSWTVKRFTANVGVRLDTFRGVIREQTASAGAFVPARSFARQDNVPNLTRVAPRLAFVYDLTGRGKTALKWNVSQYSTKEGASLAGQQNPMRFNTEIRSWVDANGDGIPQRQEIGPGRGGLDRGASVRLDPDLEWPYQWEYTASLSHQWTNLFATTVSYYHRKYERLMTTVNVALGPDAYLPVVIPHPLTGEPFTVYNQKPATRGQVENVLRNSDELGSSYNGFEVTFDKRMANNFMAFGGVTIGSFKECDAGAASTNPNQRINSCGYGEFDSTLMTNLSGIYRLPYDIYLAGHLKYASGRPTSRDFVVTRALVPDLTQVSERIIVVPAGDLRLPSWTLLDIRISKKFDGAGVKFEPVLDIYNVLNENATLREVQTIGSALGRISGNVEGRMMKFAIKMNW